MNYEFNLLHHVGVVAKRVRAPAAADTAAAHEGDDNTPSGPTGRGVMQIDSQTPKPYKYTIFKGTIVKKILSS